MSRLALTVSVVLVLTASCARSPAVQPSEMSAAAHEMTAAQLEQHAAEHVARYDPNAGVRVERCKASPASHDGPCWTSIENPTAEHLEHAAEHRRHAADHRAASQTLREAEARACAGISDADRDESPFAHIDDIDHVERLYSSALLSHRLEGAVVSFRAVPGMTAASFQQLVECHLARNAALGNVVPEMAYCPLVPKNVTAKVITTPTGFDVQLRSDDDASAKEVARRAESLRGY